MESRRVNVGLLVFAAVIALIFGSLKLMERRVHVAFLSQAHAIAAGMPAGARTPVTEADLARLPEPAARWLRSAGVVGKPRIRTVHVTYSGRFRPGERRPLMPIQGEYYLTTARPSLFWYGRVSLAPGLWLAVVDSYVEGRGHQQVKALSLVTLSDERSKQLDLSTLGHTAAELTLAPTFLLDEEHVRFLDSSKNTAKYRVEDAGLATDVELSVGPDGTLASVQVIRYLELAGKLTPVPFTVRVSSSTRFGALQLPSKLDGYWNLPDRELHYSSLDVESVETD